MLDKKTVSSLSAWWVLLALAILSFIPTLFLPYVGEEGVYTIISMEMAHRGAWRVPTLYGEPYSRPPLVNWLMMPLANGFGWQHVLLASRIVAAAATVSTGLLLVALAWRVYGNLQLAVLSGLLFFSGDVLFNRGWMAYADPHFGFFIFLAIASMLLAVRENRPGLLIGVLIGLIGSFMSKALTGYVFYATFLLVACVIEIESRRILLHPVAIAVHILAVAYPFFWWGWSDGDAATPGMVQVMIDKLSGAGASFSLWTYIGERFVFSAKSFIALLPGSALAAYLIFRARGVPSLNQIPFARVILWSVALSYLPYLVSPATNIRYILPLYPWCALLLALLLIQFTEFKLGRWVPALFGAMIAIKLVVGAGLLSWYAMDHRGGDFREAAQHAIARTTGHPLYIVDSSYLGLSVTAHIDSLRFPQAPLTKPGLGWTDAFVLARSYHFPQDRVVHTYRFAKGDLHLRCRGTACPNEMQKK